MIIWLCGALILVLFVCSCNSVADITVPGSGGAGLGTLLGGVIGIYEVVVRIWPTVGDKSLIGLILKILKVVSDALNVQKK